MATIAEQILQNIRPQQQAGPRSSVAQMNEAIREKQSVIQLERQQATPFSSLDELITAVVPTLYPDQDLVPLGPNLFLSRRNGLVWSFDLPSEIQTAIEQVAGWSIAFPGTPSFEKIAKKLSIGRLVPNMQASTAVASILAQAGAPGAGGSYSYSVQYSPVEGLSEAQIAAQKAATYLQLAAQEEQRRQQAMQTLQQLLPFAVPPDLQYFPGFEPNGPMAYIHALLGLPPYAGYRIRHTPVDLGTLLSPSPFVSDVLRSLAGVTPEASIPPFTLVPVGQSQSGSYGTSGGGGLSSTEALGSLLLGAIQ